MREPAARDLSIDRHIGHRLRDLRIAAEMSREALALELGVTQWDIRRCEAGRVRLKASQLYSICLVLKVPIGALFEPIGA